MEFSEKTKYLLISDLPSSDELYHFGVKGQRWGVRRYQNKDGTRTSAGKKREKQKTHEGNTKKSNRKKVSAEVKKKILIGSATALTVAAAATLYGTNPSVRKAVNSGLKKAGNVSVKALKNGSNKAVSAGKNAVKSIIKGTKQGIKEGINEAPKKVAKAIVIGAAFNVAKKALDSSIGKEKAAKIFKANNNKKIDSFWKVGPDDRDDRDE